MSLHEIMRWLSILLTLAGCFTGLRAAALWKQASRLSPIPSWLIDEHSREPVDPALAQAGWSAGITATIAESGKLNEIAAKWTAYAVGLSAFGSMAGSLS